jgi:16S rRNA (uracil1498-N3)-methyltransferase
VSIRFYCPDPPFEGRFRLGADEARHLCRVCRIGVGEFVEIFDGRGFASRSEVVAVGADWAELVIAGAPLPDCRSPIKLAVATAIPKGDRFDWLVEKATEIGVDRLIPIVTERSVIEPGSSKLARLRRSIIESSKQCGRNHLMVLESPTQWGRLIDSCRDSLNFLADRDGTPAGLASSIPPGQSVTLAVGPEGGFTTGERDQALQSGWNSVSFNVNTLRVETAVLAGCAVLFSKIRESNE